MDQGCPAAGLIMQASETAGKAVEVNVVRALETNATEQAVIEPIDQAAWEALAAGFGDYNYQQTWAYGMAMAQRRGAVSEHIAIYAAGKLIALADVRVKRLPLVGGGIAYISSGPLTRRGISDDAASLDLVLASLVREYVQRRGMALRILPPVGEEEVNQRIAGSFAAAGFRSTQRVRGYRTFLVSITASETVLRAALAQKWRNCLNASERQGLNVEFGSGEALFDQFITLLDNLVARKGFDMDLDARFYADVQRELPAREKLVVALVRGESEVHAGGVFAMHGENCVYLLGATAESGMKNKASYLLHWRMLLLARERGMRWYDLGGIDPVGNAGVYNFKRGFSGRDVSAAGPFEFAPAGLRYGVTQVAESLYRTARRSHRPQHAVEA